MSAITAALLATAIGLLQPRTRTVAWRLGAVVFAGMLAGYLASRTVGLPLGDHEVWDPSGAACLLLEAAYLAAFAARATNSP